MPTQTQTPVEVSCFRTKLLRLLKQKMENILKQRECSENQSWTHVK